MGWQHTYPRIGESSAAASPARIIILGMHRGGTPLVTGIIEDQGFASGADAEGRWGDNWRGMREHPQQPSCTKSLADARDLQMCDNEYLNLWEAYNTCLLATFAGRRFPVIEFGGSRSIGTAVTAAFSFYGFRPSRAFRFFDPDAGHRAPDERESGSLVGPRVTKLREQILACAADPEVSETCVS
jgi:hypothetical protein